MAASRGATAASKARRKPAGREGLLTISDNTLFMATLLTGLLCGATPGSWARNKQKMGQFAIADKRSFLI
jgi:hypothetical protein